jgi:Tol biopolymer transport system component
LAVVKLTGEQATFELATLGPQGGNYRRVLVAGVPKGYLGGFGVPSWSPDGAMLAFAHAGRGQTIAVVPATGGSPRPVPGTRGGVFPVFSPDGRSIAFTRQKARRNHQGYRIYESTSVWIVDLETGESRQLTRWRNHLEHVASSFSPDGTTLLVTRLDRERSGEPELVALRFDGRASGLLVGEGALPVYSPDGSKIALFRQHSRSFKIKGKSGWRRVEENLELYVINADGTRLRRLTHTPQEDETFASWDPSGERIAYSQFQRNRSNLPNSIMQINANGTCPTKVLSEQGVVLYGPAWQPGPGREAGRIAC